MQKTATSIRPISRETSAKLANMGFVCALLVVAHHVRYFEEAFSYFGIWERFVSAGICTIAVPAFFSISGFLLAGHMDEQGWVWRESRKRIHTLLIPALCWIAIYAIYAIALVVLSNYVRDRPLLFTYSLKPIAWLRRFGLSIWCQPSPGQLWYVRALLLFVLCGTLFKKLNSPTGLGLVFLAYAIICPVSVEKDDWRYPFRFFWSLEGTFYFLVGIYLRTHDLSRCAPINKWQKYSALSIGAMLMGTSVAAEYHGLQWGLWFHFIAIPFLIYGVYGIMPSKRWPDWLVSLSFPIFILHAFVLKALAYAENLCGLFQKASMASWLGKFIIAAGLSAITAFVLRKLAPRCSHVVFGGR